jgi:GT2 family glycosyltransferase
LKRHTFAALSAYPFADAVVRSSYMCDLDVSVVIPTYFREELVLDAIASACSQRGVVEVIVVDDSHEGSAEESVRSVRDPRVRYVHRTPHSGGYPGAVRNQGAALARAPLLHFLDDDDTLVDGALHHLSAAIRATGAAIAFGRVLPFGNDLTMRERQRAYFEKVAAVSRRIRGRHWFAAQLLFVDMPTINSACMIRRDVFEAHGGYDPTLRCCEDVDLLLRVGRAQGFTFVNRDVLHYRVGAPSIMSQSRNAGGKVYSTQLDAYRKMHTDYKREYGVLEYRALQLFARARGAVTSWGEHLFAWAGTTELD